MTVFGAATTRCTRKRVLLSSARSLSSLQSRHLVVALAERTAASLEQLRPPCRPSRPRGPPCGRARLGAAAPPWGVAGHRRRQRRCSLVPRKTVVGAAPC